MVDLSSHSSRPPSLRPAAVSNPTHMPDSMEHMSEPSGYSRKQRGSAENSEGVETAGPHVFITHTVLDVRPDTRIVAICAVTDDGNTADPTEDGWLISEFYAFNYLLKGTGAKQTWLSAADAKELIRRYGLYTHENSRFENKVVLDQALLDRQELSPITLVPAHDMVAHFLRVLDDESRSAITERQSLLVFIFAHCFEQTQKIWLGPDFDWDVSLKRGKDLDPWFYPENHLEKYFLHREEFQHAVRYNARVTLITTACYSNGWAVDLSLDLAAASAAKWEKVASRSQSQLDVAGCGSIYNLDVYKKMVEESKSAGDDIASAAQDGGMSLVEDGMKSEEEKARQELVRAIGRIRFMRTDGSPGHRGIVLSSQSDDWAAAWGRRLGLPLSSFKLRWNQLKSRFPAANLSADSNPVVDDPQLPRFIEPARPLRLRFGGNIRSARMRVLHLARTYLASNPNPGSQAPNTSLHGRMDQLYKEPRTLQWDRLEDLFSILDGRLSQGFASTRILQKADMPLPRGLRCEQWCWLRDRGRGNGEPWDHIYDKVRRKVPKGGASGWPDQKDRRYVVSAIHQLNAETDSELDKLVAALESGRCSSNATYARTDDATQPKRR